MLSIIFVSLSFIGCSSEKGGQPKNINEDKIYPEGDISEAKIFDRLNNEIKIVLTQEDIDFIVQTVKDCDKELVQEYEEGMVEINVALSDSTIQLLRKDNETIYYVFHNKTYNGVCYKVQSKELSDFINKVISIR